MKLYFHPLSGNSRRVLLVAEHLGVPLERVLIDLTKGEQRVTHVRVQAKRNRVMGTSTPRARGRIVSLARMAQCGSSLYAVTHDGSFASMGIGHRRLLRVG